jgi:coenzyme F420-0:L-glutamate ligase/coenzyme F420-1:gamma-L-glutamate ligase
VNAGSRWHPSVQVLGLPGLPDVRAGDDLAALILRALAATDDGPLRDGDIVVVSSKVVSKAAGLSRSAASRDGAVEEQTLRVVAERATPRGVTRIVQAPCGAVLAAAGVDASNVPTGEVVVLPADPDAEADRLRLGLSAVAGVRIGVVVSDTAGRPWRDGQVDFALGAAGIDVTDDLRGRPDTSGVLLEVTVRALADELASAADLVKGKVDGVPVAIVRGLDGLARDDAGPGARSLQRPAAQDWFRLGHVEAMRTAIGVGPASGVPPAGVGDLGDGVAVRLTRAVRLAAASQDVDLGHLPDTTVEPCASVDGAAVVTFTLPADAGSTDWLRLGALVQRVLGAARADGLTVAAPSFADTTGQAVLIRAWDAG